MKSSVNMFSVCNIGLDHSVTVRKLHNVMEMTSKHQKVQHLSPVQLCSTTLIKPNLHLIVWLSHTTLLVSQLSSFSALTVLYTLSFLNIKHKQSSKC